MSRKSLFGGGRAHATKKGGGEDQEILFLRKGFGGYGTGRRETIGRKSSKATLSRTYWGDQGGHHDNDMCIEELRRNPF